MKAIARKKGRPKGPGKHSAATKVSWANSLWQSFWFPALLLAALTIVAYFPARNGDFIWDDDVYIIKNQLLTAPDGLRRIWFSLDSPSQYFPLVYTSFRIEFALWGLNPTGYHWVNLLLHAANGILVWRVLGNLKVPWPWMAAALFGLHPVQVESVAWITERKNVLMGLFFLSTLLAWLRSIDEPTRRKWFYYGLSLCCYALALSAKTTACTLPAAMLLILWFKRRDITVPRLAEIIPFGALGVAMGAVSIWWERFHIGTQGVHFSISYLERVLIASRAVCFYLGKLLWPFHFSFFYPKWIVNPADPAAYSWIILCLLLTAIMYFARRKFGRGPATALLYFSGTLAPLLGFIMLYTFRYSYVADHYQYLACVGPFALFTAGMAWLVRRASVSQTYHILGCAALLLLLTTLSWRQSLMYGNAEALWRTTIARNPGCGIAYNNLGNILYRKGKVDEAMASYQKAAEIAPLDGEIHFNLGAGLLAMKRMDESIVHSRRALELDPELTEAHYNLGNAYFGKGDHQHAITSYREALRVRPDNATGRSNLAICLVATGKVEEGLAEFQEALKIQPGNAETHYNLGYILTQIGRLQEGEEHLHEALRLRPSYEPAKKQLRRLGAVDGLL